MKKILAKKGFTLIELIVVIAILAILAAILIPSITSYITEATKAKDLANARSLYSEVVLKAATDKTYAATSATLGDTTCTFTVTSGTVSNFACIDKANATITLDFLTP